MPKTIAPKKPRKKKPNHGLFDKTNFKFSLTGEALVSVHNAIAFTMAHADLYERELPVCDHCLSEMDTLKLTISHMLDYAEVYTDKTKRN